MSNLTFYFTQFFIEFLFLLGDILTYGYILLKLFKLILAIRITFDQFYLFNPFQPPLSQVRILTQWYLRIWWKYLPPIEFGAANFSISTLIGFEFLSILLRLVAFSRYYIYSYALTF